MPTTSIPAKEANDSSQKTNNAQSGLISTDDNFFLRFLGANDQLTLNNLMNSIKGLVYSALILSVARYLYIIGNYYEVVIFIFLGFFLTLIFQTKIVLMVADSGKHQKKIYYFFAVILALMMLFFSIGLTMAVFSIDVSKINGSFFVKKARNHLLSQYRLQWKQAIMKEGDQYLLSHPAPVGTAIVIVKVLPNGNIDTFHVRSISDSDLRPYINAILTKAKPYHKVPAALVNNHAPIVIEQKWSFR